MTLDTDRDFAGPAGTDRNDARLVDEARREEAPIAFDWPGVLRRRLFVLGCVVFVWVAGHRGAPASSCR